MAKDLKKIGPSQFTYFEKCRYRFVLSRSSDPKIGASRTNFNRYTFLGVLIHEVIERYYKNEFELADYDDFWESIMVRMIDEVDFPPHVDNKKDFVKIWSPYYSIKKAYTKNLLQDFELIGGDVEPEKLVESGHVKGRIDLFERINDRIRIVDFKTGLIFNYQGLRTKAPKKEYVDQLTLYGAAFAAQENVEPSNITIVLRGLSESEFYSKQLTDQDCSQVGRRLESALKSTENAVQNGSLDGLATPEPETCRYCEYIQMCKSVQDSVANDPVRWQNYIVLSSIDAEFNYEDLEITVIANDNEISISNIPIQSFNDLKMKIDEGKTLFLLGLYAGDAPSFRKWTQYVDYFEIEGR